MNKDDIIKSIPNAEKYINFKQRDLLIELQDNICRDWLNFSDTSVGMSIPRLSIEEIAEELASDSDDNDIVMVDSHDDIITFACEGRRFVLYKDGDTENGYDWHIKELFTDYNL